MEPPTLVGAAEAGVCTGLWFGSLPVQDVLHQFFDAEFPRTHGALDAVD